MKRILMVLVFSACIIPNLDWCVYLDLFPEIREVSFCESRINNKALNPNDPDTRSVGLLQFKDKTFFKWAKLAEIDEPDIWNPWQQIVLYRWAKENNLLNHWSCYRTLSKNSIFRSRYVEL